MNGHSEIMNGCSGDLYDGSILKRIDLSKLSKVSFDPPLTPTRPGDALILRPLNRHDFAKGYPQVLSQLTAVGDVTEDQFIAAFDRMRKCPDTYYVTVIEDTSTGKIIGSATLLMEQKFIHDCGLRGRIEDVVVNDEYRGKQLGKLLLAGLVVLAKELECYKLSLDCKDKMIPFYETFGFVREDGNGNFMTIRF